MFFILKRFSTRIILKLKLSIKGFVKNSIFDFLPSIFSRIILCPLLLLLLIFSCKEIPTTPNEPIKPPGYQEDIPWPSLADSPWPMNRGNPQFTGRSNYIGPQSGLIEWQLYVPGVNSAIGFTEPVIGADSTIYFGSSYEPDSIVGQRSYLYAVKPNGIIKWKFPFNSNQITATPIVGVDGTIYCGSYDGNLYAINSDGSLKWKFNCESAITYEGINIDLAGTIYFVANNSYLYAVDSNGTLKWRLIADGGFNSDSEEGIAISPDGKTLYVPSLASLGSKSLYAISLNGEIKWSFDNGEGIIGNPLVDSKGNIYFDSNTSVDSSLQGFISLKPSGEVRFIHHHSDRGDWADPTIDKLGNIFFISDTISNFGTNTTLISLDYNFNKRWETEINFTPISPLSSDLNGDIYFYLFGLNSWSNDGRLKFRIQFPGNDNDSFTSQTIGYQYGLVPKVYDFKSIIKIK